MPLVLKSTSVTTKLRTEIISITNIITKTSSVMYGAYIAHNIYPVSCALVKYIL